MTDRESNIYAEIVRLQHAGEPCALCTITKTVGSTPGKTTMKMLVRRDGTFVGTVGGGCLEAEVLEASLQCMRDEKSRTLSFALNERDYPDSGLLCGGQLEIFVEPIVVPRLVLFGGGHVSGAIAHVAHSVGFHVTIADDRESFATRANHPDAADRDTASLLRMLSHSPADPNQLRYPLCTRKRQSCHQRVLQFLCEYLCWPRCNSLVKSPVRWKDYQRMGLGRGSIQNSLAGAR